MDAATLDLTKLAEDLGKASKNADREAQKVLVRAGEEIAAEMRNRAPVKTGRLSSSIQVWVVPGKVTIGPDVFYAAFVEFGTGTRGEFPTGPYVIKPVRAQSLTFKVGGKWVSTREVIHPGIRPKPFARPAAQDYLNRLSEMVADVGVEMITGGTA